MTFDRIFHTEQSIFARATGLLKAEVKLTQLQWLYYKDMREASFVEKANTFH